MKNCGTCKNLLVRPDKDGKVRVRKGCLYACTADIPPMPKLSESVAVHMIKWPSSGRSYMEPVQGKDCFFGSKNERI